MKLRQQMYLFLAGAIKNDLLKKANDMSNADALHNVHISVIGGIVALGMTLILGSYGYTWGELKAEQEEKRLWRKEHQELLEKKFDEVKQGQEKLNEELRRSNTDTNDMLKQILEEQKKQNNATKQRRER